MWCVLLEYRRCQSSHTYKVDETLSMKRRGTGLLYEVVYIRYYWFGGRQKVIDDMSLAFRSLYSLNIEAATCGLTSL